MDDICNFIPPKNGNSNIEYFHFVYETGFKKLVQPMMHNNFYVHLVYKGEGNLTLGKKRYSLTPGTLFFTAPFQSFRLESDSNLTYFYISFNGKGAEELLRQFNIDKDNCVFYGFEHLIDFWIKSIRRITHTNANTLTESVFLHTLSYISFEDKKPLIETDRFESVMEYIHNHYTDTDMSISKVSDMFFYSKKYFSSLFVKNTGVKFTDYLSKLRVRYAEKLISENITSVSVLSERCGFSDPLYFSKVFKKITGKAPSTYIRKKEKVENK